MGFDSEAITISVKEVGVIVRETLQSVETEAMAADADAQVGAEFSVRLYTSIPDALDILNEVRKEIENKSITEDKAKEYFAKLKILLEKVRETLKPIVARLPTETGDKLRAKLEEAIVEVTQHALHIYDLLKQ